MVAALLAVLSLAGTPAGVTVQCNPDLPQSRELGLTVSDTVTIVNGQPVMGTLNRIELGTLACGGLLYTSASASERQQIRKMNPAVNFDQLVGVGLQVALHEAYHAALNSQDECRVEKSTRAQVNDLIAKMGDSGRIVAEQAAATVSDAGLPALYHGC